LAGDLKDERPEGIKRGKFGHPGPWTEVRPRVHQPRENRIRLSEKLSRLGIGDCGRLAAPGVETARVALRSTHRHSVSHGY
jgi:hypothetical protein